MCISGKLLSKNVFRSGRFAARFVSQDWSSDCRFTKAVSREPLSLTPPPPEGMGARNPPTYPPAPQTFFPPPQPPSSSESSYLSCFLFGLREVDALYLLFRHLGGSHEPDRYISIIA